jgi:hypothetical protein
MIDINEIHARANKLLSTGNTKESAAIKLSAEFEATAYVSKGKLWASFVGDNGTRKAQVLA